MKEAAGLVVPSPIVPEARLRHDVGEGQGGGMAEQFSLGLPPPLTPPHIMPKACLRHDGEGNVHSIRGWQPSMQSGLYVSATARKC